MTTNNSTLPVDPGAAFDGAVARVSNADYSHGQPTTALPTGTAVPPAIPQTGMPSAPMQALPMYNAPNGYAPAPQPYAQPGYPGGYAPAPAPYPTVMQQVNVLTQPAAPIIVVNQNSGPGFLVRSLYFLFIGWWITGFWISLAWMLNVTILGLPLGLAMLNRIPQVMTLSPGSQRLTVVQVGNTAVLTMGTQQLPILLRALYFVCVGWWVSLAWTLLAYGVALTVIGLPISFMMFNVIGPVTTLRKN